MTFRVVSGTLKRRPATYQINGENSVPAQPGLKITPRIIFISTVASALQKGLALMISIF